MVDLLTGNEHESVVPVATLLIIAFAADRIVQVLVAYFYANDQPRYVTRAAGHSVAVGLASIVALGLWWGAVEAAAGAIIMKVVCLILLFENFKHPDQQTLRQRNG